MKALALHDFAFVALAAFALLFSRSALAADAVEACSTISARPASAIVVPLEERNLGPSEVTIEPGERLCLATKTQDEGGIGLQLSDTGAEVTLRVEATADATTLVVSSAVPGVIGFIVRSDPTRPAKLWTIGSDQGARRIPFDRSVRRLVVYRWRLMASPGVLPPPLLPYEPRSYVIAGLPTVFARLRRISVSEFDAALVANGGRPLPRTLPGWGAAFEVSVKRFRFDLAIGDTTAPVQTGSGTLSMDVLDGGLDAGYEFLRWRGLTGLALVGIEGSALRLTGQTPAWNFLGPPAASVIGSKETTLSASSAALSLQAGFDEAVPLAPIMNPWADAVAAVLSLRGGYQRSLADAGHWGTTSGAKVAELGPADLSGVWVALGLGLSIYEK